MRGEEVESTLLELERAALARWLAGDPDGFLEISAEDVTYFDPFVERRIDGLSALREHYAPLRGKIFAERFEILNARVQQVGDMALLTYNFVSHGGNENALRWNCTEAYQRLPVGWRITQTHWSFTRPRLAS